MDTTCLNRQKLAEFQADTLSAHEQARIAQHIAGCAACERELLALARTAQLVEALPAPAVPDHLWQEVAVRLQPAPARQYAGWWWRTTAGVGVAALLLFGIAVTRLYTPSLPAATAGASAYVAQHELLSAQDPLADRAGIGVLLASDRSSQ